MPGEIKLTVNQELNPNSIENAPRPPKKAKKTVKLKVIKKIIVVMLTLVFVGILSVFVIKHYTDNKILPYPLSKNTEGLLGYDLYYPNQKLLPYGLKLDAKSFSDNSQAIIYIVNSGSSKIVFSDQPKPTPDQLAAFITKNMPLHRILNTSIGTATIGAINNQSVVSLPTKTNAWVIITAPSNIDQGDLNSLIKSIQLSK